MLWVALYCPTLPLDRIQRRLPEALALPLAVYQAHGSKRFINHANATAMEQGIVSGQAVAGAMAICPGIMLFERDTADESQAIREAALACLSFTPSVHVMSQGLLLEVQASARLFGGRRALLYKIQTALHHLGLSPAIGVAPTAHGAWLLARSIAPRQSAVASARLLSECLDPLPVALLDHAAIHLATLSGIGCRRIGELRALPRTGVARRFGVALLEEIDRAYTPRQESFCWFEAPLEFSARLELIARVETTEALLFGVKRLMTQLAGWLTARRAAISRLVLDLRHERWRPSDQAVTSVVIGLSQPNKDPEHLLGLVRERLGQLVLSSPVEELVLSAEDVTLASDINQELFPTTQSTNVSLNRLIEKLAARLGPASVTRVASHSDYRPERAFSSTPARAAASSSSMSVTAARPCWLMKRPEALSMTGHRPVYGSALSLLCGPERIESGWWDDALVQRDYYIAENECGQLLWIYRERHASHADAHWFLHGLFA
jgi:protein ImuB